MGYIPRKPTEKEQRTFDRRQFLKRGAGVAIVTPVVTSKMVDSGAYHEFKEEIAQRPIKSPKKPVVSANLNPKKHLGAIAGIGTRVLLDGIDLLYVRDIEHGFESIDVTNFSDTHRNYVRGPAYMNVTLIWSNESDEQIQSLQPNQSYHVQVICKDGYGDSHVTFYKTLELVSLEMRYPLDDAVHVNLRFKEGV